MVRIVLAALFVVFVSTGSVVAQNAEAVPPEEIARLIGQLDADEFKVRESALHQLVKAGDAAVAPLQAALDDEESSAEKQLRAKEALKRLSLAALKRNAVKLSAIIEEARLAQKPDWEPERLAAQLDRLVEVVSEATGTERRLPVRFGDVTESDFMARGSSIRKSFIKLSAGRISSVENSIVLADTAVEISSAQDCIIIAEINANISSASNCIIIAGREATIRSGQRNLILSGGSLSGLMLQNSTLGCAGTIQANMLQNSTALNLPPEHRAAMETDQAFLAARLPERATKFADSPGLVLEVTPPDNSLKDAFQITTAINLPQEPLVLFRRKGGDGEYVARANQEICFPDGKPIPELAGWRLTFCGGSAKSTYAVFRKADEVAVMDASR